jgi:outer membrane protein assembly factor BamB
MSVTAALHAYTGDIVWWLPNTAVIRGPVAIANGVFYQAFVDGALQAINSEDGRTLWEYQLPTAHRGGITIANGALYTSNGALLGTSEEEENEHTYSVYAFTL